VGQKVSPISFRLGITQQCRSRWYAKSRDYGKLAVEDEKIRRFIKKNYSFAAIPLIEIERTREKILVIIHSARPGVLIGRRGANIEKVTDELNRLTKKLIELKIVEVTEPGLSAQLIAEEVAQRLEKRMPYRRILHQTADNVMNAGAKGIKIELSGRIGGIEIARSEKIYLGKVPLHTFRAIIDYALAEALGSKGKVGVKVWVFKGEVLPEDKIAAKVKAIDKDNKIVAPAVEQTNVSATALKQE
jgi:small subunit ribosomal protein S3